ncbi:MAG TPA: PPC domain-containing DNA-binding protein [Vicinamibacterales bacterium]|nr:PPC domain-containing DNA-binding protein [Vicinamibacterales bacterium]
MKAALIHQADGLRTFAIILQSGDEVMRALADYAREQQLQGSHFTAIGAFSDAVVAYFDWPSKRYRHIDIAEQVEVLSLVGDIALEGDEPKVHAHVVLAKADASAHGGHLIAAHVRPTLEIVLTETPRHLRRRLDPESGLALIDPRV